MQDAYPCFTLSFLHLPPCHYPLILILLVRSFCSPIYCLGLTTKEWGGILVSHDRNSHPIQHVHQPSTGRHSHQAARVQITDASMDHYIHGTPEGTAVFPACMQLACSPHGFVGFSFCLSDVGCRPFIGITDCGNWKRGDSWSELSVLLAQVIVVGDMLKLCQLQHSRTPRSNQQAVVWDEGLHCSMAMHSIPRVISRWELNHKRQELSGEFILATNTWVSRSNMKQLGGIM